MKKTVSLLLCVAIFLFSGCTASYLDESEGDKISPVQESEESLSSAAMPLYFRYYNDSMLIRCTMNIDTTPQQLPEYYAISALISGSIGQRTDAKNCFGKNTKLIGVEDGGKNLYVTLSDGFISDTSGENDEATRLNRKMAIYSIVNTVCEMGTYSSVQIYIYKNKMQQRPVAYEMGIGKTQDNSALGMLSRDTSLILTPSNTVRQCFTHYSNLEWTKLYYYLTSPNMPTQEEMAEKFTYLNLAVSEFNVEDNYTVSDDGKSALVQISFKVRSEKTSFSVSNVPLKLSLKNNCWLVNYDSFISYLGVTN